MSRRPDPQLAERRRQALVRAGYAEILEKGAHGITIDSVVARAGSSKGGALYYFRTKEDLMYAVFEWLLSELDQALDRVTHTPQSPRARLASEIEVLFHSADVNRKLYAVFFDFVALSVRSERFRLLLMGFLEKCSERDTVLIEEGIRQRQFRQVRAADAALTLRALVDGYCLQWIMSGSEAGLEEYRDRARAVLGACLLRHDTTLKSA